MVSHLFDPTISDSLLVWSNPLVFCRFLGGMVVAPLDHR